MIEIEKPKIETIEISDDATYGKFVVEPLERGYGTNFCNSLISIIILYFVLILNSYPIIFTPGCCCHIYSDRWCIA
ncbi:hypothetical protein J2S08_003209 [Bacillus chungangensis]|uniref:DNA-directed RNA polymerase subunit alpha n=1 Tax=Bacillus chungangensis TaxID=587633 RepID=A0ABT9WX51_9BACI|nr:hypothetical protein [Bacillus chungangensis]